MRTLAYQIIALVGMNNVVMCAIDLNQLMNKIWMRECAGRKDYLIHWHKHEQFPSLGMGHFIWYPKNYQGKFTQTFPELLKFLQKKGVQLPSCLSPDLASLWNSRDEYVSAQATPEYQIITDFLYSTRELQTEFIVVRFKEGIEKIKKGVASTSAERVSKNIELLEQTDRGMFALIDYVHFKGEGTNPQERYNGQGWGLLQVLEDMTISSNHGDALKAFVASASKVLSQRVQHEAKESVFLEGWLKRVRLYQE